MKIILELPHDFRSVELKTVNDESLQGARSHIVYRKHFPELEGFRKSTSLVFNKNWIHGKIWQNQDRNNAIKWQEKCIKGKEVYREVYVEVYIFLTFLGRPKEVRKSLTKWLQCLKRTANHKKCWMNVMAFETYSS